MTNKPLPDMRDKQQVAVRMTDEFAKDLNLLMASYKLSDASRIIRAAVGAQADYVRHRMTERQAASDAAETEETA